MKRMVDEVLNLGRVGRRTFTQPTGCGRSWTRRYSAESQTRDRGSVAGRPLTRRV
jgi:hypothetical protein